ncbi:MAG TPA: DnaB-like helicase C-terminal domain-containing protein [Verrucomicrobiae bacterium]|nr:DnaB-like helicase C-terminal domain-containing protein [Verrucomicrobiae bacterium]
MTVVEYLDVERKALGCLLLAPALIGREDIRPEWFTMPEHRRLVDGLLGLPEAPTMDPATLAEMLVLRGAAPPDRVLLAELSVCGAIPPAWRHYKALLIEAHATRTLREAMRRGIEALDGGDDVGEVGEQLAASLAQVASPVEYSASVGDEVDAVVAAYRRRWENPDQLDGLGTGFSKLDRRLGGLRSGQLVVVGARPGVGKSAFLLNVSRHVARAGEPVLFVSLEMSAEELTARLIADLSSVSLGSPHSAFREKALTEAAEVVRAMPLHMVTGVSRLGAVVAAIRRDVARYGAKLVCIDYCQLIEADGDTRAEAVGRITRALKLLAVELRLPVIAASQLNRDACGNRPALRHLRESGSIEQDCDIALLLHRPEEADYEEADFCEIELDLAKHRNGPTGVAKLTFNRPLCRFMEPQSSENP